MEKVIYHMILELIMQLLENHLNVGCSLIGDPIVGSPQTMLIDWRS